MRFALLHSPLVGAGCWQAVVATFAGQGVWAVAPRLPSLAEVTPPYFPTLAQSVAGQVAPLDPVVLVVHSGAGALATSVAAAAQGRVSQVIFVDAILPNPGRSWFETTGDALGAALRAAARDGCVPAWDQWFPPDALGALLPDPAMREDFLAGLTPTPIAYLEEVEPALDLPEDVAWSYLRLSKTYEDEASVARAHGIATLRLDRHHLAMMTHPDDVATALINLVRG